MLQTCLPKCCSEDPKPCSNSVLWLHFLLLIVFTSSAGISEKEILGSYGIIPFQYKPDYNLVLHKASFLNNIQRLTSAT